VSDWGSVGEMINHGYSPDLKEAALHAVEGGCDMDMESRAFIQFLPTLVKEGKIPVQKVDEAVRRILKKKMALGLFENPYKYCNEITEKKEYENPLHIAHAHDIARKSIVLLKNDKNTLPLSKNIKSIALIGPLVKSSKEQLGFWSYDWPDDTVRLVSLYDGLKKKLSPNCKINYAIGSNINDTITSGFAQAIDAAMMSEVVIMHIGEERTMSGEARSRSNIHIPGVQEKLVEQIAKTGKPLIVIIGAGRPTIFNITEANADAVLYSWWLGIKGGDAIADVIFGDYNPSAKLTMTFPRSEGQIPIYYNHLSTGRPPQNETDVNYVSAYNDLPNSPAYPFGFGLSYTTFTYDSLQLNNQILSAEDTLNISINVKNTGSFDGEEIVQMYIRDVHASLVQPIKSLKGFEKILIKKGASAQVHFKLTASDLMFHSNDGELIFEPGYFDIMVGKNARDVATKRVQFISK
jgi:beta-glucosidase